MACKRNLSYLFIYTTPSYVRLQHNIQLEIKFIVAQYTIQDILNLDNNTV